MRPDLTVYAEQLTWLLDQFDGSLASAPVERLARRAVRGTLETNTPLAIAKHAAAVMRVYALGFGAGEPVTRNRAIEFSATPGDIAVIRGSFAELRAEIVRAFDALPGAGLDVQFVPAPELYGEGEPRPMTPREAIVESIRHTAIHLGELRLTLSQG